MSNLPFRYYKGGYVKVIVGGEDILKVEVYDYGFEYLRTTYVFRSSVGPSV